MPLIIVNPHRLTRQTALVADGSSIGARAAARRRQPGHARAAHRPARRRAGRDAPGLLRRGAAGLGRERHRLRAALLGDRPRRTRACAPWRRATDAAAGRLPVPAGRGPRRRRRGRGALVRRADWTPRFVDYLYTSLSNSMAFSATDAMPLSPRVKLLMGAAGVRRVRDPRARDRALGQHPRLTALSRQRMPRGVRARRARRGTARATGLAGAGGEARADDAVGVDHERRAFGGSPARSTNAPYAGATAPCGQKSASSGKSYDSASAHARRACFESTEMPRAARRRAAEQRRGCRAARRARPCRCARRRTGRRRARPGGRRGSRRADTARRTGWRARSRARRVPGCEDHRRSPLAVVRAGSSAQPSPTHRGHRITRMAWCHATVTRSASSCARPHPAGMIC